MSTVEAIDALFARPRVTATDGEPDRIVVAICPPYVSDPKSCFCVVSTYHTAQYHAIVGVDSFTVTDDRVRQVAVIVVRDATDGMILEQIRDVRAIPGLQNVPVYVTFVYDTSPEVPRMREIIAAKFPDVIFADAVTNVNGPGAVPDVVRVASDVIDSGRLRIDDRICGYFDGEMVVSQLEFLGEQLRGESTTGPRAALEYGVYYSERVP